MTTFFKGFVRIGVVCGVLAALGLGGMCLVAGKDATTVMLHDAHLSVREMIDSNIEDPAVLRHQLSKLQEEYPDRIASVRKDLAELNSEIRRLDRDQAIADRVVALADEDLAVLAPLVSSAQDTGLVNATTNHGAAVRFQGKLLSLEQAASRWHQIQQTRSAYASRAGDAEHDLVYLQQQAGRLEELLLKLETERGQFESQIDQLDRQIDAIARNERLIELMNKRQRTIEECSRYEAQSLDHIVSKLDEIRAVQEAELEVLASAEAQVDYVDVARTQLQAERDQLAPVNELLPGTDLLPITASDYGYQPGN